MALAHLVEEPRQVVGAALAGAVGKRAPAVGAAVLLVVAAVEVAAPAPLLRSHDERRRVDRLDLLREVERLVADLVHRRRRGTDVAMRGVPDARLVVEDVVAQPAVGVGAPAADEMLDPSLLKERRRRDVGVVRVVAGDELAVRAHAVAGVGVPLPVGSGLRAVFRDREAGELARGSGRPSRPTRSWGPSAWRWRWPRREFAKNVSPRSPAVALPSAMLS